MAKPIRRLPIRMLRTVLMALAGLSALPVGASEFCVTGSVGLENALHQAEMQGDDTLIRLVQGSYTVRRETFLLGSHLTIIGGHADSTCTTRSHDPALTVLRPVAGSEKVLFYAEALDLGSLTFRGFDTMVDLHAKDMRLSRVRFEGPARHGNWLFADRAYVDQSVVTSSGSTGPSGGYCALVVRPETIGNSANMVTSIQHSVVANNPNLGVCIRGQSANGASVVRLDNNILHGNPLSLRITGTSDWWLRNNIIDGNEFEFGAADPAASAGNIPNNPQFINAAAGDFRLSSGSPAINSARTTTWAGLPQYDIVGNPRWIGPAPDRGAHESTVDGSQVLTVTQAGDSLSPIVAGTLRWAIEQANANPNPTAILFNIPGACPRSIVLAGNLPPITSPVFLFGYTQPGSRANTSEGLFGEGSNAVLCVRIVGNGAAHGLRIPPTAGANSRLVASGLSMGGFGQAAIAIEAGSGSSITGSAFITGNVLGTRQPFGIFVAGNAEGTQIGGPDPGQKNVIQNSQYGIALNPPSRDSLVQNNLIGLDADGNGAVYGNDVGVGISARNNTVRGNAIAGNGSGVSIFEGDHNAITGNTFGLKVGFQGFCGIPPLPACPSRELPNSAHGVLIQGAANDNRIMDNTIANSGQSGIRATGGLRNTFFGNPIWNTGGLGIDLNNVGPDPIDNDGAPLAAGLANRGLNAPTVLRAEGQAGSGRLEGQLSTTNGQYTLEAYVSPSCDNAHRPMRRVAGYGSVTISGAAAGTSTTGGFHIDLVAPPGVPTLVGQSITVIAHEYAQGSLLGFTNTSEASTCTTYAYADDTIFAHGFD